MQVTGSGARQRALIQWTHFRTLLAMWGSNGQKVVEGQQTGQTGPKSSYVN